MKLKRFQRKNLIILSLVMMLALIGYINFSLNKQALLQTSSELEKYEMAMMKESGILTEILGEEEMVLSEGVEGGDEAEKSSIQEGAMENAVIVDSRDSLVSDLAKEASTQISEALTNKEVMTRSTYFIESRLERDKKRSEMISNLNEIINNSNTNQEIKAQAQAVKLNTVTNTEKELMIESMILAKGFSDVVVYLTEQSVNIVVQSDELTSADVAKIVDIVRRETQMPMDNIIIMNKN